MIVVKTISELRVELSRHQSRTIGFVPTMGALHQGHISLINECILKSEISVCSIFVNPTQFNNEEDLAKYPKTIKADIALLESAGCDILFLPTVEEIYPSKAKVQFDFGKLERVMEGQFRPGHFSGVALVVSKLFNIVKPNLAFFGKKDFQQLAIIKQLVKDLSFDIKIIGCDTVREESGLAMSSRNQRLNEVEKKEAAKIYQSLLLAKNLLKSKSIKTVLKEIHLFYHQTKMKLEYFEIVDSDSLQPIENVNQTKNITICAAAYLGKVRLIDNISL